MNNEEALTLKPTINNLNSDLENYNLYELTFVLSYFVNHNRAVLDALYGNEVSEKTELGYLRDKMQTVTLGFDKETQEIKYFSYNQRDVKSLDLTVSIFIQSTDYAAELVMEEMEQEAYFPNEENTVDETN